MSPAATALIAAVTSQDTLNKSVETYIQGEAVRIQTAINAALAGGLSASDLAGVQAAVTQMQADAPQVPAALIANTSITPAKAAGK